MHPTGVTDQDIIAAFRFKGAASEADALVSINNGTKYTLVKSGSNVTWSSGGGFFIPAVNAAGLENSVLPTLSWGTVAVKFSDATPGENAIELVNKSKVNNLYVHMKATVRKVGSDYNGYERVVWSTNQPVYSEGRYESSHFRSASFGSNLAQGVLSADFSGEKAIWYNGVKGSFTAFTAAGDKFGEMYNRKNLFGHLEYTNWAGFSDSAKGSVNIHAVVIFNRKLSDTEMQQLHSLMLTM